MCFYESMKFKNRYEQVLTLEALPVCHSGLIVSTLLRASWWSPGKVSQGNGPAYVPAFHSGSEHILLLVPWDHLVAPSFFSCPSASLSSLAVERKENSHVKGVWVAITFSLFSSFHKYILVLIPSILFTCIVPKQCHRGSTRASLRAGMEKRYGIPGHVISPSHSAHTHTIHLGQFQVSDWPKHACL